MTQEELQKELFWQIEAYDNPVEVSYSREETIESLIKILNRHVAEVIEEIRPTWLRVAKHDNDGDDIDALCTEMRKRAKL